MVPNLTCRQCGNPVPLSPALAEALESVPVAARTMAVLCDQCATGTPTLRPTVRVFRVAVTLEELGEVREGEAGQQEEVWEQVGGFVLKGSGESVRSFVDQQAAEWSRRMEMILTMADAEPVTEPPPPDWPPDLETKEEGA